MKVTIYIDKEVGSIEEAQKFTDHVTRMLSGEKKIQISSSVSEFLKIPE